MSNPVSVSGSLHTPVPIGQVVALLRPEFPEISSSTLRYFEREGLLAPRRTSGGHRLYRPEDIERVRMIRSMQRQRLQLAEIQVRLGRLDILGDLDQFSQRFLERVVSGDLPGAAGAVRDADRLGLPLESIFGRVIAPALHWVGDAWERGEFSVGQEKEATQLARELVFELSASHASPARRHEVVMVAGVEGDEHGLGLHMVVGLLREQGFLVHDLGPGLAVDHLIEAILLRRPDALLLGATLFDRVPVIGETMRRLQLEVPAAMRPCVIVGGAAVQGNVVALKRLGVIPATSAAVPMIMNAICARTGAASG